MKTIILDAIYGKKDINEFMHIADIFEPFKQLAEYKQLELSVNFNDSEIERAENTINILKEALEESGMNVIFLSIRTIDNIPVKMKNYINKNISVISTGKEFGMLHEILSALGYKVETNEQMQVIKAEII